MYSFNIFSLISLVTSTISLFLGVYILLKNPKSSANKLFFLVNVMMFIWGLGECMMRASVDPGTAYFWAVYVTITGATFNCAFLLHFWLTFSEETKRFKNKIPIFVLYIPPLILTAAYLFRPEIFIQGFTRHYWGYSIDGTRLYLFYMFYIAAYSVITQYFIFRTVSKTYGKMRKQAQYIGLGMFFVLFIGILTQVSQPFFHFPIPELTVTSTIVFTFLVAYAVNKYGMMTISSRLVAENIIGTMEDYVIAADKQMKIVFINNSALVGLGYKEEELMDKPINAILSADISHLSYDQALERFPLRNYQAGIISKNGGKISVSANASVLKEGPTDVFGFVFVLRDMRQINQLIEELRVAKTEVEKVVAIRTKELQEEGARLTASINSLSMGFAILDKEFNVLLSNHALEDILGSTKSERLTFKDIEEQFMKYQFDLRVQCEKCFREKTPVEIKEVVFVNKSLRMFLTPIFILHDSNEIIGIAMLIENITEQKRLEDAKSSFVAITAHELRTPLTVVRGNAELLLEMFPDKLTDTQQIKKMIDAIQRSGVRLLGIVNDFLDLTALEEHKIAFKKESFNLVDLAGEVVADFLGKAAAKSLSLTVVPPYEPLPEVLADRDRAREIIINLLGNAIQYTEKGGVTLSFKKGEGVVELSVTDTGAGIKPDDQKSLFQKFQTVSERFIHSKEYGSGMGLYISNLLAESMNGTVRLKESTQGIGSTFTATLPISDNKRLLVG